MIKIKLDPNRKLDFRWESGDFFQIEHFVQFMEFRIQIQGTESEEADFDGCSDFFDCLRHTGAED